MSRAKDEKRDEKGLAQAFESGDRDDASSGLGLWRWMGEAAKRMCGETVGFYASP